MHMNNLQGKQFKLMNNVLSMMCITFEDACNKNMWNQL